MTTTELYKESTSLRESKRYDEALHVAWKTINDGLKTKRPNPWHYRNLGFLLNHFELFELSIRNLEEASRTCSEIAPICLELARSYKGSRQASKAIEWANKGLSLNKGEVERRKLNYVIEGVQSGGAASPVKAESAIRTVKRL